MAIQIDQSRWTASVDGIFVGAYKHSCLRLWVWSIWIAMGGAHFDFVFNKIAKIITQTSHKHRHFIPSLYIFPFSVDLSTRKQNHICCKNTTQTMLNCYWYNPTCDLVDLECAKKMLILNGKTLFFLSETL
jgi:hypothetical protein